MTAGASHMASAAAAGAHRMARPVARQRQRQRLMDGDDGEPLTLAVNETYARKYEERKKREELTRLADRYKNVPLNGNDDDGGDDDDDDDDDDEEEDDKGELLTPGVDKQIMRTLALIKARDPRVYDPTQKFFSDEHLAGARAQWEAKQTTLKNQPKPMKLKDYEREQLLKGHVGDEEEDTNKKNTAPTYMEEQKQLKEAFRSALQNERDEGEDEDGDDLFTTRKRSAQDQDNEEEEYKSWLLDRKTEEDQQQASAATDEMQVLKRYWSDPKLDPAEQFLRDYVLNRGWMERSEATPTYEQIVNDDDDSEELEKMEEFEYKYNFRFEEPDATTVKTYARDLDDSVRRKNTERTEKRKAHNERKTQEKQQKQDELHRLRELKRREILEKLKKIEEISGAPVAGVEGVDLEGDFDPEAHDRAMEKLFDDSYYVNGTAETEKPQFTDEYDEFFEEELIMGQDDDDGDEGEDDGETEDVAIPENDDVEHSEATSNDESTRLLEQEIAQLQRRKAMRKLTKRQRERLQRLEKLRERSRKKRRSKKSTAADEDPEDVVKRVVQALETADDAASASGEKHQMDALLDEYYQLNYEDIIGGDQPTRFKYRQVTPSSFGLTMDEILLADDRDLNAHVSLKKLAPYRPADVQEQDMRRFSKAKRVRIFRGKLKTKAPFLYDDDDDTTAATPAPAPAPPKPVGGANRAVRQAAKAAGISADRLLSYSAGAPKRRRQHEAS